MKTKKAKSTLIQHFWTWFTKHQEEIRTPATGTNYISEFWEKECRLHLQAIDRRLGFEIWHMPEKNEHWLIITAFGQAKCFPLVDAIVEQAPYLKGWTFLALFPPTEPDFLLAQRHDLDRFNPLDLVFSPLFLQLTASDDDMLILYANDDREVTEADEDAIWDLLYNLIGERSLCSRYSSLIVMPKPDLPDELIGEMRPITALVDYFPAEAMSALRIDSRGKIKQNKDSDGRRFLSQSEEDE